MDLFIVGMLLSAVSLFTSIMLLASAKGEDRLREHAFRKSHNRINHH